MKLLSLKTLKLFFNIILIYFTAVVFSIVESLKKKCKSYTDEFSKPDLYSLYIDRVNFIKTMSIIIIVMCSINLFVPITKFFGNLPLLGSIISIIMLILLYVYLYFLYEFMNKIDTPCEKKLSKFEKFHRDFMLSGTFTIYILIVIIVLVGVLYF